MDTRSQHLFFDAVCENDIAQSDIDHIKKIIEENLTVVNRIEHKFHPQGETIVFILSESHFAIHTYPENKYLSMDVYICNMDINLNEIVSKISEKISFTKIDKRIFHRGKIGVHAENDSHLIRNVYAVTVITATCSILYELLLAQALSTTMGNTALRYNTTIGLYVAAMGFGALMYGRFVKGNILKSFLGIELSISVIGVMAPILVLVADYVSNLIANGMQISYFSNLIQIPLFTFNHFLIVLIGFISGLELPLLINLGKKYDDTKGNYVLAFDYLGTLLGAILFPIVILPRFDIFSIAYIVSFMNILAALFLLIKLKSKEKKYYFLIGLLLVLWILAIVNAEVLNEFIVQKFYFGGKV